MRLYLSADTKENVGYIPEWIKLYFSNNIEIVLDISGGIDYSKDVLDCRVTGVLTPWVRFDENGEETDLSELDYELSSDEMIEMFNKATNFDVGVYPITYDAEDDDALFALVANDVFTNCDGLIEIGDYNKRIKFGVELNV